SSCSCLLLFLIWITPQRIRIFSDKLISIQFKLFSPTSTTYGCNLEDKLGSKRNSYYLRLSLICYCGTLKKNWIQKNNMKKQKGDSMDSGTLMNAVFYFYDYLFIVFCIGLLILLFCFSFSVVFSSISLWILSFSLVFNDSRGFLLVYAWKLTIYCVLSVRKCSRASEGFRILVTRSNYKTRSWWRCTDFDQEVELQNTDFLKIYIFWSGDQTTKHKNFENIQILIERSNYRTQILWKYTNSSQETKLQNTNSLKIHKFQSRDHSRKYTNFSLEIKLQNTNFSKIYKLWSRDQTTRHKNCNLDPFSVLYVESKFSILLNCFPVHYYTYFHNYPFITAIL
uniref:Uncharacterized protein n=1 Tax=Strongyloides stercoralis TaxID=6248 RepID=A0AAF5CZJ5_STRER